MARFIVLVWSQGNVTYHNEVIGHVPSSDQATSYESREDAQDALDVLRSKERWRFLIHGASAMILPD